MPTHTPDERRKRLRDKLAQDILDRRAALERSQRSAAQRVSPDPRQRMAAIFNRPIGKPVPPRTPQPGLLNRLLLGGTGSELVRGAEVLGRRLVTPAADVVRGRGLPSVQEVFNRFPERLKQPPDRPGAGLGRALSSFVGGTRPFTDAELDNPLLAAAVAVPPATPLAPLAGALLRPFVRSTLTSVGLGGGRSGFRAAPPPRAATPGQVAEQFATRPAQVRPLGQLRVEPSPVRPTAPTTAAPKALPAPAPSAPAPRVLGVSDVYPESRRLARDQTLPGIASGERVSTNVVRDEVARPRGSRLTQYSDDELAYIENYLQDEHSVLSGVQGQDRSVAFQQRVDEVGWKIAEVGEQKRIRKALGKVQAEEASAVQAAAAPKRTAREAARLTPDEATELDRLAIAPAQGQIQRGIIAHIRDVPTAAPPIPPVPAAEAIFAQAALHGMPGSKLARGLMEVTAKMRAERPAAKRALADIRQKMIRTEGDSPLMMEEDFVAGRWVVKGVSDWSAERLAKYGFVSATDLPTETRGLYYVNRAQAALPPAPAAAAPKVVPPTQPALIPKAPAAPAARVSPQQAADRLAAISPEKPTVASLTEKLDDLSLQYAEFEGMLEVAEGSRIVRPRWAVGLTNSQVEGIARHEGRNPFLTDWGDGIDQVFVKSVRREGLFKESQYTITSLRQQRASFNRDVRAAEAELAELQILEASAQRTAEVTERLRAPGGRVPPHRPGEPRISERAVPGTEAYLPELPTIDQVLDVNFKENWARTLGQRLSRIPVVGEQLIAQVNPSVLAMDTSHKGIISYLAVRDAGDSAAVAAMHAIDELRHAFKVDKLGRVTNVKLPKGASADIGDVLTFPDAYPLNEAQREYARRAKALLDKNLASQRQRGVKIKPITSFDDAARQISLDVDIGGGRYFPRVVVKRVVAGEEAEIGRGPIKGAIGAKQTQAKPRSWPTQRQGREQGGNIYLADPTETLRITLMAGRRAEADAILASFIRKQPGVGTVVDRLKARFPEEVVEREMALQAERNRLFARNLLMRVVRGETPTQQSMAKLRRDFPQMAEDVERATGVRQATQPPLGEVRPTFRTPGGAVTERARRRVLDSHIAALEDLADGSRRRVAEARASYNQAKLRVAADPVTEAQVAQPAFQGLIMPKEMAEQINLHLTDQAPKILQSISNFNDVLRMLETGLDPGFLLIQGAIPLLTNPAAWGKATSISLRSLAHPVVAEKYFQLPVNRAVIDKMVRFSAAPLSSSEFVAAGSSSVLSRLPVAGVAFRRGAQTFNNFLDVGRIEMHKALGVLAKDDNAYRELTTSIDQMFGVMSSRQLGVTPTRRAVEGALLLYAPRYRRAGAALMLAVFQGGLRGQVARKALSHFIFGNMAFWTGLAAALGQWDRLDPRKGRNGIPRMYDIRYGAFLSVQIGDSIIGVGGVTISGLRLLGNLSRGLSEDGVKGVALTAFRTFRGMTSPFTSDVIDLATGKAGFTGEDTWTPLGIGRMLSEDLMPFYVEPFTTAALEALAGVKRQAVGIETFIGNLIGTRERGISPYEKRTMARDQWAVNSGQATLEGQPAREWKDLNRGQQKEAERQEPELKRLMEEIDDLNYRRADRNTRVRLDVVREEREDFEAEMNTAAESMARGVPGATREWYDKERSRIRAEHRGATNVLWAIRALGDAGSVKALQKWILENQRLEDAVSDLYFERREKMLDTIPVKTSLDWDRINLLLDRWLLQTYGRAIRDYVLAHKGDWMLSMPDSVRAVELQRQREIGEGIWFNFYFYDRPLRLNIQTPRPPAPGQAPQAAPTPAPAGPPQPSRPIRVPGFVR